MTDTSFLCVVPGRSFMDTADNQVSDLEAGFIQGSELPQYYFNDFGIYPSHPLAANDFSGLEVADYMNGKPSTDNVQPGLVQDTTFEVEHHSFQNLMDSQIGEFNAQNSQFNAGSFSDGLGGFLHSTSQLPTERALCRSTPPDGSSPPGASFSQLSFMSSLPLNYPPMLDNSSSPSISHPSESDDDPGNGNIHFYNLPGSFPLVAHQQNRSSAEDQEPSFSSIDKSMSKADCLTPLEMPDGSTRLTANWLPVDPEGGFTIADPGMADEGLSGGAVFDAEPRHYGEDAFFNADSALSTLGV